MEVSLSEMQTLLKQVEHKPEYVDPLSMPINFFEPLVNSMLNQIKQMEKMDDSYKLTVLMHQFTKLFTMYSNLNNVLLEYTNQTKSIEFRRAKILIDYVYNDIQALRKFL